MIWELTLYSVPSSLRGLGLDYAVSCLGVWAQEDAAPAMQLAQSLARTPSDGSARARYAQLARWAEFNANTANSSLVRAGRSLGLAQAETIALPSLALSHASG